MHHIYHTEGIILGSRNFSEAGKCYYVFTRDLGMLFASASGVRKLSSKLRYVLQDYSYVKLDFVKGKDIWRITSASKSERLEDMPNNKEAYSIFVRILALLKRLLAGEDANTVLFDELVSGFSVLERASTKEELQNIEMIIVLRALHNLGYIGNTEGCESLIQSPFEKELIFNALPKRSKILSEINKAIRESGL